MHIFFACFSWQNFGLTKFATWTYPQLYHPFQNFRLPFALKIVKFLAQYISPQFLISSSPNVKSVVTLQVYTSQFLNDNAGLMRKKLSRPLLFNLYIYHCQEEISQTYSLSFSISYREGIMLNSSLLRFHCRTRKLFTSSFIISPYISHTNNH